MQIDEKIRKLIEVFGVANDDLVGNTARIVFSLKWKQGLSARNQAHKILDELALTHKIVKGKHFYAVSGYQGKYGSHGKAVAACIAKLILLKLPLTIYREVSLPIGLRPDVVGLIGKNGKAVCFCLEVCVDETDTYFQQKVTALKNFKQAPEVLSRIFNVPIPYFSLVVHGKRHPDAIDFDRFLEALQ